MIEEAHVPVSGNYYSDMYLIYMLNEFAADKKTFKNELFALLRNGNGRDTKERIQELLEANNALVERVRKAEHELAFEKQEKLKLESVQK